MSVINHFYVTQRHTCISLMRYEGKHNFFKKSVKNFKNITKTLAKKHQHQLAFHWESFYFKRFQFGPFDEVSTCTLEGNVFLTETWNVPTVSTTTWVKNYGTEYQVVMYVCSAVENEMPVFNKIVSIIVKDGQTFLLASNVITVCFDEHVHAFCIEEVGNIFTLISVDELIYYRPYDMQFSYDSDERTYIVPCCVFVPDWN